VAGQAQTSSRLGPQRAHRSLPGGVLLGILLAVWHCPVAELWGVPCPGCGLTRAAWALATGDLVGALRLHPLSPALIPFGACLVWRQLTLATASVQGLGEGRRPGSAPLTTWLAGGFAGLLLVVWIARFFGAFGGPVPVTSHLHG
jgi:hypothetical protein